MSDDKRCPSASEPFQRVQNGSFGFHVNGTGWLIQNQNGRVLQERPRNRNALAFAAGKAHAAFANNCFITAWQAENEIVRIGSLGRSHDLRLASVGTGIRNILGDAG